MSAPPVIDGVVTGGLFRAWVETHLAPELRPGWVVVMDNLPTHRVAGIWEAVEATGAALVPAPVLAGPQPHRTLFSKLKRPPGGAPPGGRATSYGTASVCCSTNSPPESAGTTSGTAGTTLDASETRSKLYRTVEKEVSSECRGE